VYYHMTNTQEERKSKADLKNEEDELSTNEPDELYDKLDDILQVQLSEGPRRGANTTQDGTPQVQLTMDIPMEQG